MMELNNEYVNPFSKELAWSVYQKNRSRINDIYKKLSEIDEENVDVHDLLIVALEMIGKMTDNTIFFSSVIRNMNIKNI